MTHVNIPNPVDVPFDVCVDWDNGKQLCMKSTDQLCHCEPDCNNISQRVYKYEIDVVEYDEYGNLKADYSIWAGVDDNHCFWIGEGTGNCAKLACIEPPNADEIVDMMDDLEDLGQNVADWCYRNFGHPAPGSTSEQIIITLVVVALFFAVAVSPAP
jgi:hypothetical protein